MQTQAEKLYDIVPALYRHRDTDDLKKFFVGTGMLMDQLKDTLDQYLADNYVDNPVDGSRACQEWLLPYFADLLDVRLVSPLVQGKRDEIAKAVRWRQGKGSLRVIEEVAEAIGQLEVVVQEGWKRVASTARLNIPLIPATAYGYSQDAPTSPASMAALHPGLAAATVDLRCPSGAVSVSSSNPAAQQRTVDGETELWRQTSLHGVPCYPNSYADVSKRTVDIRCPDWRVGHYHPDTVLLYTAPPCGFFKNGIVSVNWSETPSENFLHYIDIIEEDGVTIYRNKTYGTEYFSPVKIRRVIKLGQEEDGVGSADFHTWHFEGLILENTVELDSGQIVLNGCAARKVEVHSIDYHRPVLTAKDTLFKNIQAARGIVRLEYCTVLDTTLSEILYASDCIFIGLIKKHHDVLDPPDKGCIRYSALNKEQQQGGMQYAKITQQAPVFFNTHFGERSCAVLHPAAPKAIVNGAEDGSEMGCYDHRYYSLLNAAIIDKLQDYLPLGKQACVIPDETFLEELP